MPANHVGTASPAPVAGPSKSASPPSPSPSFHQVGSRQGTRNRTRTRRTMSSSTSDSHRTPRYSKDEHPLAPHNLDAAGYHSFRCLGVPFHVKKRYLFVRELGIGAYGCVALCHDSVLDCNVAIKKVTRIFEKDVLARRALREVAILRHIGMCDNVTALLDFDTAFINFSEIYLVLSASEADLSQIIRSGQSLSDAHLQYFMAQILRGIRYMHVARVVHRDLKPGNLLVNADCALRICDFGLARAYADHSYTHSDSDTSERRDSSSSHDIELPVSSATDLQRSRSQSASPTSDLHLQLYKTDIKGKQRRLNYPGGPLTEYVATRWYRAPEVMLCFREGYGSEIDMWSVGCILAELIAGKPIFPGKDYVDQIARIHSVLGSPSDAVIEKIGSERAKTYMKSLPDQAPVPLRNLYPDADAEALDLISKLLTWDPDQRLSADEALQHPWLKAYHESNARWQPPQPFDNFDQVEYIHSLRQFKGSMQREADELRLELEALEEEEEEHLGGPDGHNSEREQQTPLDTASEREQQTKLDTASAEDADRSGNELRADEADDSSDTEQGIDADAVAGADMLRCSALSHSSNSNNMTASSGSSIHTPSSTSGASADEAEPVSPRPYEACNLADKVQQGEKTLQHSSSFFRLGHEEEGRHGVFMPNQVLAVAQGLLDHQLASRAALTWPLPSAKQCSAQSDNTTPQSHRSSSFQARSSQNSARSGPASTPSLGLGLLDDAAIIPSDGSSAVLKSSASFRHSKQLVILQDSAVQSCASLVRELIRRATQRQHPVLLVSTLRPPSTYLDTHSAERVDVIDATDLHNVYEEARPLHSLDDLLAQIASSIDALGSNPKLTVLVDSLETFVSNAADGVAEASRFVRSVLGSIGTYSRLVLGVEAGSGELQACLNSPLIWSSQGTSAGAGTVLTVKLHPPALLRYVLKSYGLRAPSTSSVVWTALSAQLSDDFLPVDVQRDSADSVDGRFWDVLRNTASRGPLGVPNYEPGGGAPGWWASESCAFESLSFAFGEQQRQAPAPAGVISLADVLNEAKTGYAVLDLRYQARNGKAYEELIGVVSFAHRLHLVPLDMADHRQTADAATANTGSDANTNGGNTHWSMMSTLPFNLSETDEQRERRETVPLPYAYHQNDGQTAATARGSTGNATIFFEPEQDDDEDEEDPDDDLDL